MVRLEVETGGSPEACRPASLQISYQSGRQSLTSKVILWLPDIYCATYMPMFTHKKYTYYTHTYKDKQIKIKIKVYFTECNQRKNYQLTAINLSIFDSTGYLHDFERIGNRWQTLWQWDTCQPFPALAIQMDSAMPVDMWFCGTSQPWHMEASSMDHWCRGEWGAAAQLVPILILSVCLHGILMLAELQIPLKVFENTFSWF